MKTKCARIFAVVVALVVMLGVARGAAPNVLLIVADDLGWGDVPWRGTPARMPHLDALRQSGTELLRFYASPVCSPTRAALLTGRSASASKRLPSCEAAPVSERSSGVADIGDSNRAKKNQ